MRAKSTTLLLVLAALPFGAPFATVAPFRPSTPALSSAPADRAVAVAPEAAAAVARASSQAHALFSGALRWGLSHCSVTADDMMMCVVSPHTYWLLREWRRRHFGDLETTRRALASVREEILALGESEDALRGASVTVRTKGLWSTFHKAAVCAQPVHDVLAVRVVLRRPLGADDCFAAHHALQQRWRSRPGRHKDYVSAPKANGYQALHDTKLLPTGQPFEVQIRSQQMHREAEYGAAAHRRYKRYKGAAPALPSSVMSGVVAPRTRDAAAPRWPASWPADALASALSLAVA